MSGLRAQHMGVCPYQDHYLELLTMLIMNASPYPRGADVESVYTADLVLCYVDGSTCHLAA